MTLSKDQEGQVWQDSGGVNFKGFVLGLPSYTPKAGVIGVLLASSVQHIRPFECAKDPVLPTMHRARGCAHEQVGCAQGLGRGVAAGHVKICFIAIGVEGIQERQWTNCLLQLIDR